MSIPGQDDILNQIENYRTIVLTYEGLNDRIHALLRANNGATEHMSAADLALYRDLARQRDEASNEMRWLEQQLLNEDDLLQ